MAQAQYITKDKFIALFDIKGEDEVDENIITDKIINASNGLEIVTGRTFAKVTRTEVIRRPDVILGADGVLRVRTRVPRITAINSLRYRVGTPASSWLDVPTDYLDWDAPDASPIPTDIVRAYLSSGGDTTKPIWAEINYEAGYVGDETDPYPGDLQEIVFWWTQWLYRTKDVSLDKTANPMMGTVTIPSAMPSRLKAAIQRWSRIALPS